MRGDDWLNNEVTQKRFGDYVENELAREAAQEINRLKQKAQKTGVTFQTRAMYGKPCDCLITLAEEENPDLIFIGAPRLKGEQGYNSRMKLDPLVRALKTPLIIVPRNKD
jgi:nucleotide-binding universal stress UspA family protein